MVLIFSMIFIDVATTETQMYNLGVNYDIDIANECGTPPLLPLYLSKNDDTLIFANYEDDRAIIYNRRD